MISIHVPIAGNDRLAGRFGQYLPEFQSTFPLQGTTLGEGYDLLIIDISIHVPIAGNDNGLKEFIFTMDISIHVPIAGND